LLFKKFRLIRKGKVFRTDIHHTKWSLQRAEAILRSNSLTHFLPRTFFEDHPLAHYAASKQALFWLPVKEETDE
jgi:hypothetical protein